MKCSLLQQPKQTFTQLPPPPLPLELHLIASEQKIWRIFSESWIKSNCMDKLKEGGENETLRQHYWRQDSNPISWNIGTENKRHLIVHTPITIIVLTKNQTSFSVLCSNVFFNEMFH